jgi:DNA-binding CsgD family transcriptional regulator
MIPAPRGYGLMQRRIHGAMLKAADTHDLPITVRHADILSAAVIRAAKPDLGPEASCRLRSGEASHQQRLILTGAANGLSNAQIARQMGLTENTIKSHLHRFYQVSGATCRAHAVALAMASGVIELTAIARPVAGAEPNPPVVEGSGHISAVGSRRRIQALQAVGYPLESIAAALGTNPGAISRYATGFTTLVNIARAAEIRDLYEQWTDIPGPSSRTRERAAQRGWLPPSAWGSDIDDPAAGPRAAGSGREGTAA